MNVVRDSVTGFLPLDTVRLTFSEPVDTGAFSGAFSLSGGGPVVAGSLRWNGSMSAMFVPAVPFTPGAWYAARVRLDSVVGLTGRRGPDSLLVRHFRIAEERMLAGISGKVIVGKNAGAAAAGETIIVEARIVTGGSGAGRLRVSADASGGFSFEPLPEGRYVLWAFVDRNGNLAYDCGRPHPVKFAEPFGLLADTLKLRPRWPIDGVRIDVGK
jgi:hypothetical protein